MEFLNTSPFVIIIFQQAQKLNDQVLNYTWLATKNPRLYYLCASCVLHLHVYQTKGFSTIFRNNYRIALCIIEELYRSIVDRRLINVSLVHFSKVFQPNFCFSRTQSSASRPEDDEHHITTLSKSDVVLTFQLEVIGGQCKPKAFLIKVSFRWWS